MGIKFISTSYWDRDEMTIGQKINKEQWAKVEAVVKRLNEKYFTVTVCPLHPDHEQRLSVRLRLKLQRILPHR